MTLLDLVPTAVRELQAGDIVHVHGMRCRVLAAPTLSTAHGDHGYGHCYFVDSDVLNRHDVPRIAVPLSFTRRADGTHGWSLQGNDGAIFYREPRDCEDSDDYNGYGSDDPEIDPSTGEPFAAEHR